jgi:ABC-type multidrug transport system ATPase subunit
MTDRRTDNVMARHAEQAKRAALRWTASTHCHRACDSFRDTPILILDEPSSGLDAASEHLVFDALDRLMEGKTCIIVAHRLATIRRADTIFVVQDGSIVEEWHPRRTVEVRRLVLPTLRVAVHSEESPERATFS